MWFALFALTPGLFADGPGALLSEDIDLRLAAETALVVILAVALMLTFRRERRILFAVGALFMCVHLVYLPDRFVSPLPALAMLVLGIVLALLRSWTGTLHVVLALHLSFSYLFA
ncbi:hypothetical protein [Microbacterium binotii]